MTKKFKNILLIDDDSSSNFFHKRLLLKKSDFAENVLVALDGREGIELLRRRKEEDGIPPPEIIFLDINMPVMDGWGFLEEYEKLDPDYKAKSVIIMLTSSLNPDDRDRALSYEDVNAMYNKLLDREKLEDIENKLF